MIINLIEHKTHNYLGWRGDNIIPNKGDIIYLANDVVYKVIRREIDYRKSPGEIRAIVKRIRKNI